MQEIGSINVANKLVANKGSDAILAANKREKRAVVNEEETAKRKQQEATKRKEKEKEKDETSKNMGKYVRTQAAIGDGCVVDVWK